MNTVQNFDIDVAIVGGGAVGLAIGRELVARGKEVFIIEKNDHYGMEASSRNSEVIHAGIYYPPGSLKSKLCIEGKQLLYAYLKSRKLSHQKCGKLIVAVDDDERIQLHVIWKNAVHSGVKDLQWIEGKELNEYEENISALCALRSPSTGIIDAHAYMDALAADFRRSGGEFVFRAKVSAINGMGKGCEMVINGADGREHIRAAMVINSAGLYADVLAQSAGIDVSVAGYRLHWCKGNYFRVPEKKEYRLKHLIYPAPPKHLAGLGIHATIDLQGSVKFGPDVQYLTERVADFNVDEEMKSSFFQAIRRYMPQLSEKDLQADMAGIRAKLQDPGDGFRDFVIERATAYGLPQLINLIGIESPGLTSSLAIAGYVSEMVD